MPVFRVIKDKSNPYIIINKHYIYNKDLSLKAKGLMSYFLSRPDNWEFFHNEILEHCTDKKDSLRTALAELIKAGYINRTFRRGEKGKFEGGYLYSIYENPIKKDLTERGFSETGKNRNWIKPKSENPPLLNNESKLNNECSSSKEKTKVFKYFEKCNFGLLSPILIEKISTDIDIYSKEWVMKAAETADEQGKHKYAYVKGILENWKSNGFKSKTKGGKKDANCKQQVRESEKGIGFHF